MDSTETQVQHRRQATHSSRASHTSSVNSDKPSYRLFPSVDLLSSSSVAARAAERRRSSVLLEESLKPTGISKKTIAARRGRKLNLAILKPAKLSGKTTDDDAPLPTSIRTTSHAGVRKRSNSVASGSGRSISSEKGTTAETFTKPDHVWSSKQAALHAANVKGLGHSPSPDSANYHFGIFSPYWNQGVSSPPSAAAAAAAAAPVPSSPLKSPTHQHRRQASSTSTASICDFTIEEQHAVGGLQKSQLPDGQDLRIRKVTVVAPTSNVKRQILTPIKSDSDAEDSFPLPSRPSVKPSTTKPQWIDIDKRPRSEGRASVEDQRREANTDDCVQRPSTAVAASVSRLADEMLPPLPDWLNSGPASRLLNDVDSSRLSKNRTPTPDRASRSASPINALNTATGKSLPNVPMSEASSVVSSSTVKTTGNGQAHFSTSLNSLDECTLALTDVTKQCDALHARHATLRSDRLKLTMEILANLKQVKAGPEHVNTMLSQHLSLNAINSSMDICFAKLKSLECRKDEAIAALQNFAKRNGCLPSNAETSSVVRVDSGFSQSPIITDPSPNLEPKPAPSLAAPSVQEAAVPPATASTSTVKASQRPGSRERRQQPISHPEPKVVQQSISPKPSVSIEPVQISTGKKQDTPRTNGGSSIETATKVTIIPTTVSSSTLGSMDFPAELEAPIIAPPTPEKPNPIFSLPRTSSLPKASMSRSPLPSSAPPSRPPPTLPSAMTEQQAHRHIQEDSTTSLSTSWSFSSTGGSSCAEELSEAVTPRQSQDGLGPLLAIKSAPRQKKQRPALRPLQVMSSEAHDFMQFCEGSFG